MFLGDFRGVHGRQDAAHAATGAGHDPAEHEDRHQRARADEQDPAGDEDRHQCHHRPLPADSVNQQGHGEGAQRRADREHGGDHVYLEVVQLAPQYFDARRAPAEAASHRESTHAGCTKEGKEFVDREHDHRYTYGDLFAPARP